MVNKKKNLELKNDRHLKYQNTESIEERKQDVESLKNTKSSKIVNILKNKKVLITILAIIVLLGVFVFAVTNTAIGESIKEGLKTYTGEMRIGALAGIRQTINGEVETLSENNETSNQNEKGIEIGDKAIISSAKITDRKTGTGPWDSDDNPGNDSSAENEIVRSFDQISWTIEATMGLKEDVEVDSITGGTINIEATLPEDVANLMRWDLDSMIWLEGSGSVSEDGRTLTGSYTMSETTTTVPGKQNLELILQVYGAKNGTNIQPEIKIWLEGNAEEEKQTIEVENVTVSATEKYNVELNRYTNLQKEIDVEMDEETVRGRVYGYSLVYQLYNDEGVEKGLKGVQYPEANTMTLDVNLKLEKVNASNSDDIQDITDTSTPILYNYDLNETTNKEGNIPNRPMNIVGGSGYHSAVAYATGGGDRACYDSGNVEMNQNGKQIQVTISDYQFNGKFPKSGASVKYDDNIGCFSSVYFMIFVPYTEESSEEGYNYYLTVEDSNLQEVNEENEAKEIQQKVNTDDIIRYQHQLSISGSFGKAHFLINSWNNYSTNGLHTNMNQGDAKAEKGQKFVYLGTVFMNHNNDLKDDIYDANVLMKFDGEAFQISDIDGEIWRDDWQISNASNTKIEFNMIYAAKPDGSNWRDDDEMQSAEEEDLKFYDSLEEMRGDLGDDAICVGVLFESIDGYWSYGVQQALQVALQVTDKAEIGEVYQFVSVTRLYKENNQLDRTTQTRTNPDAVFPKADVEMHNNYVKSEYDENGQIKTGTHTGYEQGQSLLIVGGNLTVDYSISDVTSDGSSKMNYDLGRGENTVGYTIKPQLTSKVVEGGIKESNVTVTVKDILPKGLTYVPGSSDYEEPEIIENEDGSTTLVWEIYNCTVGEEIRKISFKARIDENTANGTQYESSVIVSADKIGTYVPSTRTDSATIQITNLSSHRLYKETETEIVEANGEVKYKVTYQNNTDTSVPDFQILDILPYNGDGRGTAYNGTYTLKDVKVTQTGEEGEIATDNLKLYTTTSPEARKITPKDETIGDTEEEGGIWREKEIGKEINEAVTVIALKGEIGKNTNLEIELTLQTTNNRTKDVYYNQAIAQTSKDTEVITTTNIKTEVVSRQIEGMVWYDTNENGVKDEEESYANRIEVELKKADGSKAQDINGNEILNVLTNEEGEYIFSNIQRGEYIVEIHTEDEYKLTEANVGNNKEINSKFEEGENGEKQSYVITSLNSIASSEIIETNVNAGLVVKDAKIIVKYLEEDNTPGTDEDNKVLKEQKEITTYEKDGGQVKYKIGDSYETQAEQIENYITLRNSGNTSGTLNTEETVVTYYYTYNKQNIEVTKVWNDNSNQAGKRPTSIKVTLKDGNNTVREQVIAETNKTQENENIWTTVFEEVPIYRENGEKISYTVDESENEGTLESYIKTIEGMTITNTFTQNTEKIKIPVTKIWNDSENKAGKRPENVTLILKREIENISNPEEKTYVEVARQTINGTDNQGANSNEWKYTFENIAKYDENNDEINYVVEEIVPEFYTSKVEKVENAGEEDNTTENTEGIIEFTITNTFEVPNETTNIEVTKIWNDNHNRAGKRPENVTLVLAGNSKSYEVTLTKENEVEGQENIWKGTVENLPKYDENADIINYELSEENLNSIFYTQENTTINQQTKTVTNKFEVPDDKIEIEVNKKWEDNHNELGRRPEEVTLYLTGNNQEYEITLNESNKNEEDESTWSGTIENLPKYDVNGNEIIYTLDERPIASEFYTKTGIDQGSKTVTNKFGIPTESIQVPVTKIWEDNNNVKGYRPENIVLQIKEKGTGEVVSEQLVQGNKTTNEGWSYIFEVPKYNEEGQEVEYEIGERELNNKFYPTEAVQIDQESRTITNVFTVPDEKIEIAVNKRWEDNDVQEQRRPESIILVVKSKSNGIETEVARQEINDSNELSGNKNNWQYTFTNLPKYDSNGDEIEYTVDELEKTSNDLHFYEKTVTEVTNIKGETDKKEATITNTFKTPEDLTNITVNKIWNDNETQSVRRPESIIIMVKNGESIVQEKEASNANLVQGTQNQWTVTFEGLQKYDEDGQEIKYTVDEREKKTNDLYFYDKEVTEVQDSQATIRNTFVKPDDTTQVTVTKKWEDNNNEKNKRPTAIKVEVKAEGEKVKEQIINKTNEVSGNANGWRYTFEELPKYNEDGEEIQYTVEESPIGENDLEFYDQAVITGNMETGYIITNTFKVPDTKISVTVNKTWIDNEIQEQRRPESVILILGKKVNVESGEGQTEEQQEVARQEITLSNAISGNKDRWQYTFENLPKYDENGNEIEYTVEEQEKTEGDLHFYNTQIGAMIDKEENGEKTGDKEVTITNTFTRPEDKTEVIVTKIWNDNNNEAQKRPESIKLQLKNGTTTIKEQEVTEANAVQGDANKWQYTFTGIQKYDANGQELKYTVDETEVHSSDLQFYTKELQGTTVINTFTQSTDKTSVTVTKKWVDNEIQEQKRPESVVIQVKNGTEVVASHEISISNALEGDKDTWQYTFEGLPKYDELNNIINYTVDEVEKTAGDLNFYTKEISGTSITNTFVKPQDTIEIKVNKKWEDQEDVYKKRPDAVVLQVKNGGEVVEEKAISKEDNWECVFSELDKYDENGQEINYTVDEGELTGDAIIYYTKEVGKVENGEATITNRMTRTPGKVRVKYVDKNTNEEIVDAIEKEGAIGDKFDVTEDKKEIPGYTLVEEPEEKTGEYEEKLQEKIYYYAKNTEVIVKYLEKDDTPEDNTDNRVLSEKVIIEGYEGKDYTTEKKTVENYTFVENKGNTTGKMPREKTEVIYYYSPNTKVIVKYLEKDNTPNDNTDNKVLVQEEIINGYVGKEYSTEQKAITNYTFIESTENTKGTMEKDAIEVIYYYAQNTKVTVKYLEQDNTPNNSDNKVLAKEETIQGYEGKEYETKQKEIENYEFVESTENSKGTMTKDPIEVIYYYVQKGRIKIQHIDRETGEILKQETEEGKVGDIIKTQAQNFEGYVLVESPKNPNVEITKEEQTVKYYYAKISAGVIEKHIDEKTGKLLYSKEHKGNEGDSYDIPSRTFEGYDLVEEKLPTNAKGEMTKELIEVKYYYIKKATVRVEYKDKETEEKLTEDIIIQGHEGDNYQTEEKVFKGYNLVETPENAKGQMEVTQNGDGTYNTETVVTYYYEKQKEEEKGTVVEKHIDVNTDKVLAQETHQGKVGDKYDIPSREFEGYELVTKDENGNSMLPSNATGTITKGTTEVIYYYEKIAIVRVEYIDKLTGEKLDEEEIKGHEGDAYETEEKEFDGYELVEKPSNSTGEMTEEEIVVKYYYQRKAEVEIQYVEKETNYQLAENDNIEGYVGDKYETTSKDIQYYKLVGQTENTTGTMTKEKITVTYYYEKQVFNLGVDKWVSGTNIDGIPQLAQSYNSKDELYKIDIHRSKVETADVKITYTIRVTNTGEIEGTADRITELVPQGYTYNQEDNEIYWKDENGILTTDALKNETIKPGEYKEIQIVLRWNKNESNFGEKDNTVILSSVTNPARYEDMNEEDNSDKSQMLITVATGLDSTDRVVVIGIVEIVLSISVGLLLSYKKKEHKK